jgi:hypothetical protein
MAASTASSNRWIIRVVVSAVGKMTSMAHSSSVSYQKVFVP